MYLQHVLKQKETSLVKQVLRTQMINPKKKDWIYTVKENMKHLDIKLTFENIQLMSKDSYKKLIKNKIKEGAFKYLISKRNKRNGKGMEIEYTYLEMQNYLRTEDIEITNYERKLIFQLRTKMNFKIKSNRAFNIMSLTVTEFQ